MLSQRQRQVLGQVALGITVKEAAVNLRLSEATVKEYLAIIYRKLGVSNRAGCIYRASQLNLLNGSEHERV